MRVAALAGFLAAAIPLAAGAQDLSIADSLLRRGALDRAESELYAAVRARPRDGAARFALGRYLASRGALRAGATLIDEAAQFGFDKRTASLALAPIYDDLGEYQSELSLPTAILTPAETARLRWLGAHPSKVVAPDGGVSVAFNHTVESGTSGGTGSATNAASALGGALGVIRIRMNGLSILALVEPRDGCGVRLSDTSVVAMKARRFAASGIVTGAAAAAATLAVADSISFGVMTMINTPVTIEQVRGASAVVCLGALLRYAPTFDSRSNTMTLHASGTVPEPEPRSTSIPMMIVDRQFTVVRGASPAPLALPEAAALIRGRRWTLDARRGLIVIEP